MAGISTQQLNAAPDAEQLADPLGSPDGQAAAAEAQLDAAVIHCGS